MKWNKRCSVSLRSVLQTSLFLRPDVTHEHTRTCWGRTQQPAHPHPVISVWASGQQMEEETSVHPFRGRRNDSKVQITKTKKTRNIIWVFWWFCDLRTWFSVWGLMIWISAALLSVCLTFIFSEAELCFRLDWVVYMKQWQKRKRSAAEMW